MLFVKPRDFVVVQTIALRLPFVDCKNHGNMPIAIERYRNVFGVNFGSHESMLEFDSIKFDTVNFFLP